MAIKTGHPSLTKAELKVGIKGYEYDKEHLEELEKNINEFIAILQQESKQEHIY